MSGALYQTVKKVFPTSDVTLEDFRMQKRDEFPWDTPEIPHTEITTADQWWVSVDPILISSFLDIGFTPKDAALLTSEFRHVYTNPAHWFLFDDTLPTLNKLAEQGYLQVILSNHVPDLIQIVSNLNIQHFFHTIFTSALIGYEKPHPNAYEHVRQSLGTNHQFVMIGDTPKPDVIGPESLGMKGVLVRRHHHSVKHSVASLTELPKKLQEILV